MAVAGDEEADEAQIAPSAVRLLADEPAGADAFAAKAHEGVARAIAQLVEAEPGGKVIGLEGL